MEIRSRYEVISDLESKKRNLIIERESFDEILKLKEKELKDLGREVEDKTEEINEFKKSMEKNKETIKELILSIDESLKRFTELASNK